MHCFMIAMSLAKTEINTIIIELFHDILRRCPWQVIQRRVDNTTDFYRDWKSYKDGFGDLTRNFWLGGSTQLTSYSCSYAIESIHHIFLP